MRHQGSILIETERLVLRPLRISDAEIMIKNWVSDKEVTKYLTWQAYDDIEKAKEFINLCIDANKKPDSYKWGIELKEICEVIGTIDVVFYSQLHQAAEVGYCMSRRFWNRGIMTEALGAVINYLIKAVGYNRIQSTHLVDNPASGKVMQKCGMRFEGIKRQGTKNNQGVFCDTATYAILACDLKIKSTF